MTAHAKLSASSSYRWLNCAGSVAVNHDRERTENVHALLGTSAHALLEVCLRLGSDPEEFLGQRLEEHHMVVDEEMGESVGYALDYVRAYLVQNPKTKVLVEHRVKYGPLIGASEEDAWGTSDVILDNYPKECVVMDYKHGIGIVVNVKENSQLLLYAAGQRHQRGRYHRYRKVVVQPRVRGRKPVQEAPALTDDQLVKWINDNVAPQVPIILTKDGTIKPGAPRFAGDWCRYCGANGNCRAQYELVQEAAKKEFSKKDPKSLTPADLGRLLDTFTKIEPILKAVKEKAIAAVHAGVEVPGWAEGWTQQRRVWTDEMAAVKLIQRLGVDDPYERKVLSPAKAEEALRKVKKWPTAPRGEKKPNPFEFVVGMTEPNPTIVPAVKADDV